MKKLITKLAFLICLFSFYNMHQVSAETYPELCSVFNRTLKVGDVGQDVKRLQVVLGQEGIAYLASTGYYGLATERAVKVFQQRNGIYPAGKVGPQTFRFMKNLWCFGDNAYIPIDDRNPELPPTGWGNGGNNWNNQNVPEVSLQPVSSQYNNITISWNARAVNSCSIQKDNEGAQNLQNLIGQQVFTLYGESRFTLRCIGNNGREYSKQIVVRPNQTISNLPWVNVSIVPAQVLVGQSATIYWTSQNTTSCVSNFNPSTTNTSGSVQVTIASGVNTFTFTCYGSSGQSVSQTITAGSNQINIPTIDTFTLNNRTLTWSSSNTRSCELSADSGVGAIGSFSSNGTYYINNWINAIYSLRCYGLNDSQQVTRQLNVNANTGTGGTPSVTLTPTNQTITSGQSAILTIASSNVSSCNLTSTSGNLSNYGGNQTNLTNGQVYVSPTVTTTYTIYCVGTNGQSVSSTAYIGVTSTVDPSPINITATISASPNPVAAGQITNLTWLSSNANYCNISGGNTNLTNQPTSGSHAVSISQATNFTVTCYNAYNGKSATGYVYVTTSGGSSVTSGANSGTNSCSANGTTYFHNALITTTPYSDWLPTRCCNGSFWGPLGNFVGAPECSSSVWVGKTGHTF